MVSECKEMVMGYARKHRTFTKEEVLEAAQHKLEVKAATLGWVLHHLTQTNRLARVGHGVYTLQRKQAFRPEPTSKMKELAALMRRDFPFAEFCLYSGESFSGLQQHLSINRLIYLAVPRFMVESVCESLRALHLPAYGNPDARMLQLYINMQEENIIVLPLITQTPLQSIQGVPTPRLEALLVELFTAPPFRYLRGAEYKHIFRNACRQYSVQVDCLLRYASRRHAKEEIQQLLRTTQSHD